MKSIHEMPSMRFLKRLFGKHSDVDPNDFLSGNSELGRKLHDFRRKAWLPKTRDGDGGVSSSKFSGIAHIPQGQSWPSCGNCRKPMQLFVQVNSDELPDDASGLLTEGILQLFYCTSSEPQCEVDCEAYFPFSMATLARIVELGAFEQFETSPVENAFPARSIEDWELVLDLPNWEELSMMGVELTDQESDRLADSNIPRQGEKLGGWPAWIQGVEYPSCPKCNERMFHVFQIDSEKNLPYLLGDVGVGHVTRCKEHPEVLTFGWACC